MISGSKPIGIANIVSYLPPRRLPNNWFASRGIIGRKFEIQSGVLERRISDHSETEMADRALRKIMLQQNLDPHACVALVLVVSSMIPVEALDYIPPELQAQVPTGMSKDDIARMIKDELCSTAAEMIASNNGLINARVQAVNWGCPGYAKGLELILSNYTRHMNESSYVLLITTFRASRIIDYECGVTGPLFGDMATASLVTTLNNPEKRPIWEVITSWTDLLSVGERLFRFEPKRDVLVPTPENGEAREELRYCLKMNGPGVAEHAPCVMAEAANITLKEFGRREPDFLLPHQASDFVVRWTAERAGFGCPTISGAHRFVGSVSGSSIPYALEQRRHELSGLIVCPSVGIGWLDNTVSRGCILLQTPA